MQSLITTELQIVLPHTARTSLKMCPLLFFCVNREQKSSLVQSPVLLGCTLQAFTGKLGFPSRLGGRFGTGKFMPAREDDRCGFRGRNSKNTCSFTARAGLGIELCRPSYFIGHVLVHLSLVCDRSLTELRPASSWTTHPAIGCNIKRMTDIREVAAQIAVVPGIVHSPHRGV